MTPSPDYLKVRILAFLVSWRFKSSVLLSSSL